MANSEQITWVSHDAEEISLHTPGFEIQSLVGRMGMDNLEYIFTLAKSPELAGKLVSKVNTNERKFSIPILIKGETVQEVESQLSMLSRVMKPSKGFGQLRYYTMNGAQREINCYYESGLEGNDNLSMQAGLTARRTIRFLAVDPFFYDITQTQTTYQLDEANDADFLSDPFFELKINPSTLFSSPSITNTGDEDTYPVIRITGPGDNIYINNNSYNPIKSTKLSGNGGLVLAIGDVVEIDMKARTFTNVTTDANLYSYFDVTSEFWSLLAGANSISFQMENSDGNSEFRVTHRGAYSGRWNE